MQPEKFRNENESRLIVFFPPQPSLPYVRILKYLQQM